MGPAPKGLGSEVQVDGSIVGLGGGGRREAVGADVAGGRRKPTVQLGEP